MRNKFMIKLTAWISAIALCGLFVFIYINAVGLDGGYNAQMEKGDELYILGDYEGAVDAYLSAASAAPLSPDGHIKAADAYIMLGDKDSAIEVMEDYLSNSPRSLESYELLMKLYDETSAPLEVQAALYQEAAVLFENADYANTAGLLMLQVSAVPAPTLTPEAGAYPEEQIIKVTSFAEGDMIYYTTNGDDPTSASTAYNHEKGITMRDGRTMLKLIRYNAEGEASRIAEGVYVIGEQMSEEELAVITAINGNNIVTDGQTVYTGSDTFYLQPGKIYSKNLGLLYEANASNLNYANGYLYFVNITDGESLYRINLTDYSVDKIIGDRMGMVQIAGGYIIYENKSDGSALYSADLGGGSRVRITDDRISMFTVFKGNIYCQNDSKSGALYRISLDGLDSVALTEERVACINISDNFVYYMNMNDGGKIYRIATEGGDATVVCPVEVSEFTLSGSSIFYRPASGGGVYRCSVTGGDSTLLTGDDGAKLTVSGGLVYYVNYSDSSELYSMSTSGGNQQVVAPPAPTVPEEEVPDEGTDLGTGGDIGSGTDTPREEGDDSTGNEDELDGTDDGTVRPDGT